jgi:glycosyltransferase involved in cell wall biosynthesis
MNTITSAGEHLERLNFSVVIPTFNRRQQLPSAIESALQQDAASVEVVVVDDGSTDGTEAWIRDVYPANQVRVLRNQRAKGPAGARNTGIAAAQGEFVALLDSDDTFLPGHLAAGLTLLRSRSHVDVVFGPAEYWQDGTRVDYMGPAFQRKLVLAPVAERLDGATVFSPEFFSHLLEAGCYFNLSSVMFRREAITDLMTEHLRIAEDFEYWVRLSRKHRFACLSAPQIRYLLHSENISFETADSTEVHAPSLLSAYRTMLAYPNLESKYVGMIRRKMSQVMYEWGYRCRKAGRMAEAWKLHMEAIRLGNRSAHTVALMKILALASLPKRNRESKDAKIHSGV